MQIKPIVLAGVLAASLFASDNTQMLPATIVETTTAHEGVIHSFHNLVGTLKYDKNTRLASESAGVVVKIFVKEGQKVTKGSRLLELESSVLKADIEAKKAALRSIIAEQTRYTKEVQRARALLSRQSISQSSYEHSFYALEKLNAEVDKIKNELHSMNILLEKKTIYAPFDATVVKRDIDIGEWVSKGDNVFTLVDPASIEAHVNVPSRLFDTLSTHQDLSAKIGSQDVTVTIKSIIPLADQSTRTFPIELIVPKNRFYMEGMKIDVKVPTRKSKKTLVVPRDAVIKRFGDYVIFSVVDDKAVMNPVEVINYENSLAAVYSENLLPDMKVITKGNERVFPNMPVTLKDK